MAGTWSGRWGRCWFWAIALNDPRMHSLVGMLAALIHEGTRPAEILAALPLAARQAEELRLRELRGEMHAVRFVAPPTGPSGD